MISPIPAIEPESGLSYQLLYERLMVAYLRLLATVRDVLDQQAKERA